MQQDRAGLGQTPTNTSLGPSAEGIADNGYQSSDRAWCAFIRDRRWSLAQKHQLLNHYQSPDIVLGLTSASVRQCVTGQVKERVPSVAKKDVERDLSWLQESPNHHLLTFRDDVYPALLRQIPDPPIALFAIGERSLIGDPSVAIVGSRRPTPVGVRAVQNIASELAKLGIVVVSGLALGIDACAHQSALDANGSSVAVLGSGLDSVSPLRHRRLFDALCERGLVLSEYPLGVTATRYTFPQRNRIISGMSLGVVIVEAAEKSGTLITARLAAEQNREVMVLPGSTLSPQYRGSHTLIQQGASLIANAQEVLACLSSPLHQVLLNSNDRRMTDSASQLPRDCQHLLTLIGADPVSVDDIILASGLTAAEVSSMLITLEMEGAIAIASDGGYSSLQ